MAERGGVAAAAVVLAGGGYAGYGVLTGTGPVAWLDLLQQRLLGHFYPLLSFALVVIAVMALAGAARAALGRLLRPASAGARDFLAPPGAPAPAPAPKPPPAGGRVGSALRICAALFVFTWAIGLGTGRWLERQAREDAAATYQPVDLADGGAPAPPGAHLALRGIPVEEAAVRRTSSGGSSGSPDQQLVPLVGVGWRPERPVQFVVEVDRGELLPSPPYPPDPSSRHPREVVVLGRVTGPIPTVAADAFAQGRLRLAGGAALLRLVPSSDGRPLPADTDGTWLAVLGVCLIASVMLVVMPLVVWREERRRASAGRPPR